MSRGAEEVVQDLQDGADVPPRPPAAVLAVGVQSACEGGEVGVRRAAPRPISQPHVPSAAAPGEPQHRVPEKVPEKTPGAWLTKLSMTAPGLRERAVGAGLLPGELLLRVPQSTWGGGRHMGSGSRQGPGAAGQGTQPLLQNPPNSRVKPQVGSRAQQAPPVSVLLGHKE